MLSHDLVTNLNQLLEVDSFKDYCPNGLQLEGAGEISRIICGVSISEALIDVAIAKKAQAIVVHHGLFWHKSDYPLRGIKYRRVAKLIKNEINLIAYHLPLDNHPELGNNRQLAKLLDLKVAGQCGSQNLLWYGELNQPCRLSEFAARYQHLTGHKPAHWGEPDRLIRRIAWCTGGADSMFEDAIDLGVDCYLTGEASEPVFNLARESRVAFVAGGHYVSERYGIMALSQYLCSLGLRAEFIELYNPI